MANISKSQEDRIHLVGIQFRATGTGSVALSLTDLSNASLSPGLTLTLSNPNPREPLILCNATSQRIKMGAVLQAVQDNTVTIRRIVFFVKSVAIEYPQ